MLLATFAFTSHAAPVVLSGTDKDPSVVLSGDALGADFTVSGNHRAVRSTIAIAPGSGFFYYEGHREVAFGNFGFGVASGSETLSNFGGVSNQSLGVNALGYIFYNNASQIPANDPTIQANETYGFAVDYRGANPIVHVIVGGAYFYTHTLTAVTTPLYIFVYGHDVAAGVQQTINAGDNPGAPFAYDAETILTAASIDGASLLVPGWQVIPETAVDIDGGNVTATVGAVVNLTASAHNAAGSDITATIAWDDGTNTATGGAFSVTSAVPATFNVTATVLDESLQPVVAAITVDFVPDPLADDDGDGLPNGYELANGLDPQVQDANADPDLDTFTNYSEYLAGTNPQDAASFPGAVIPTTLNAADAGIGVSLSADALGAAFTDTNNHRGVRSTAGITSGSGIHYFEGTRLVPSGNFGFGVATPAETLLNFGGFSNQSIGVNALGFVFYNGSAVLSGSSAISGATTIGFAVDYRNSNPIIFAIAGGAIVYTRTLEAVTGPLHVLAYGTSTTAGEQQRINAGDNPGVPFQYDVDAILTDIGVDTSSLNLGWHAAQPETTLTVSGATTVNIGDTAILTASALSAGGIDLTAAIAWLDIGTGATATGSSFGVTEAVASSHFVTTTIINEFGLPVVVNTTVNFVEPDTDGDGLSDLTEAGLGTDPNVVDTDGDGLGDGDEVNDHGTNPLDVDTDNDSLNDGDEIAAGLDPLNGGDALLDADGDGFSNLAEVLGGTDPFNSANWPGSPPAARLNAADSDPSISVSADGFGALFTVSGHRGIRSDVAIAPGSGFYYFEGHREVASGNFGFGVATSTATLQNFGGFGADSMGVNALGFIFYNNSSLLGGGSQANISAADYYGFAVDYRGATPVVHVIADNVLVYSLPMTVTDPLHILVYGNATTAGVQQTINTAEDLAAAPFIYDFRGILTAASVAGASSILDGWTAPSPQTSVAISTSPQTLQTGSTLVLNAAASNAAGSDISATIAWSDTASAQTGSGASFTFNAASLGFHLIQAQVINEQSELVTASVGITVTALDADGDGLAADQELIHGTSDNDPDSDDDGLSDGAEVNTHGTNPLSADTDGDTVPDAVEVAIGSDPLIVDGNADTDGDGFTNADEVAQGTNPGNPFSYPGGPAGTQLNLADAFASVGLSNGALTATFTEASPRAVRSTIAISPGSGWFYFEGKRETAVGDYGIGVGTATAPLDGAAGDDSLSLGLSTNGNVRYSGGVVRTFAAQAASVGYGLAVDYSGITPVVYPIVTGVDGYRQVVAPITLNGIGGDLYIMAWGSISAGEEQITINAGDNPESIPFAYPAHYEVFTAGFAGAEFMGTGWGTQHSWVGPETVGQVPAVLLQLDANSGAGITVSPDGLSAAYDIDLKMGVRANQGMIGEFRYYEGIRLLDTLVKLGTGEGLGIGYGLITEYGRINPYPFTPEQPSMSLNSWAGIWRNLNFIAPFDTSAYYHGFAVDYRGSRPIVHVIVNDDVIHTMTLPDVFTPLHPLIYGNTQGIGVFANAANFGATPFFYDPKGALERASIDTTGFVSGWGDVNRDSDADNLRDGDELIHGTNPLNPDTDGDGLRDGDEVHDIGTSPMSDDSDADGMPDGYEFSLGQNPIADDSAGDIDTDGTDNITEYLAGTGLANDAPVVVLLGGDQTANLGSVATFNAGAGDLIDGNLDSAINWTVTDGSSGTGPGISLNLAAGSYTVTASVTDSGGLTDLASATLTVVDPNIVDTDGDGLADVAEISAGTDPADPDTDDDGLNDGAEVNQHGTNPLDPDSDGDGMDDAFEVLYGLLPNDPSDATADPDVDLRNNLLEFLLGTNPNVADPPPASEIIIDNEDSAAQLIEGTMTSYTAPEQYATSALFSVAGGTVDRFRFTPTIEQAGIWQVYAWNSCYNNRAPDVKHAVRHAGGIDIVDVDQDCDTGSHGEWFLIGQYQFDLGSTGYLEISDDGLTPPATTYMGADAARFLLVDTNAAPVVNVSTNTVLMLVGATENLSATATDTEDGDLTANIAWSDGAGGVGTGAVFNVSPVVEGVNIATASVTDSGGKTTVVTITVEAVFDDNDGLTEAEEIGLGTNPADADSDDDGANDGDEVNTHGTNPLLADTDGDGMPDGFEVDNGLDPLSAADAALDPDGDGDTNLEEFLAGTDPQAAPPPVPVDVIIVNGDAGTTAVGSWSNFPGNESFAGASLWSTVGGAVDRYRFTPTLLQSGVYEVYAWNSCYNNRATNVVHLVNHAGGVASVAVDQDCDTGTHGEWFLLGSYTLDAGTSSYLEITDDGLAPGSTTYMGADAARFLLISSNAAPVVTTSDTNLAVLVGTTVNLTATATDVEDGDLTSSISWVDSDGGSGTGGAYSLTPGAIGVVVVNATATDLEGAAAVGIVTIDVVVDDNDGLTPAEEAGLGTNPADADTDDDGLIDGDEVNVYSTDPLSADSDADGMPDGFEIANGFNPLDNSDAALDSDGDGVSNVDEFNAGTDPLAPPPPDPVEIIIDNGDPGTSALGTWSNFPANESYAGASLWATVGGVIERYRFTPNIPNAGRFEVFAWNACYNNRAVDVQHIVNHADGTTTVAVDQDCDTGTHGEWYSLGVYNFAAGTLGYLEITDDGLSPGTTTYMGADAARFLEDLSNAAPVISPSTTAAADVVGTPINLTATASDAEDGDLTTIISWSIDTGADVATGGQFNITPAVGSHVVTAAVTDSGGLTTTSDIAVTVVATAGELDDDNDGLNNADESTYGSDPADPDSDGDTLTDGDEVLNHGTSPTSSDSDGDLMGDAFEVQYGLLPLDPSDAGLDPDADGLTNLEEHDAGSDPTVAPVTEIIVDTEDAGASSVGGWTVYIGNESFGANSRWAPAGGAVERYRFTPDLPIAGDYAVYAWNSCYNNRAVDVPHEIVYAGGADTVIVDQDCDTGSHGEWFYLGTYPFDAGVAGYLEISDDGLNPVLVTYTGADAARFVRQ